MEETFAAQVEESSSLIPWNPPSDDCENPNVPDHYAYNPPMLPHFHVMEKNDISQRSRALYANVEAYLDALPPPHLKAGRFFVCRMGRMFRIPVDEERNPLVVVLMLGTRDIDCVNQKVYETIVDLIRQHFEHPAPPFRFYIKNR